MRRRWLRNISSAHLQRRLRQLRIFKKGAQSFVHHIQFAQTLDGAVPSGLSQCDVLFKTNWMPVFLTGAGSSELRLDQGVGHKFPAGTQLIAQLHLLNAGTAPIDEQVEIRMHRSASDNPIPVSTWATGSSQINVPAKQSGQAQNVCDGPRLAADIEYARARRNVASQGAMCASAKPRHAGEQQELSRA